eukprot:scpid9122/ scgid5519/ 
MASTEGGTSGSGQAESGSNSDTSKMDTVTLPVQLTSVSSSIQCLVRDLQQEEHDADRFIAGHVPPNDVEDFLVSFESIVERLEIKLNQFSNGVAQMPASTKGQRAQVESLKLEINGMTVLVESAVSKIRKLKQVAIRHNKQMAMVQAPLPAEDPHGIQNLVNVQNKTTQSLLDAIHTLTNNAPGRSDSQSTHPHHVRLPKLELPNFRGDVLKFSEFWDVFQSTVHENPSLSHAEKLAYLKTCLSGTARNVLDGIVLDNDHYPIAVELLKERFGRQQMVLNAHYSALVDLPPAYDTATSLRQLYDTVEKHIRALSAIGEDCDQGIFVSLITSKLPSPAMFQLELAKGEETWSADRLRKHLHDYIMAKEAAARPTSVGSAQPSMTAPRSMNASPGDMRPVQTLAVSVKKPQRAKCFFCKEAHYTDECDRYRTLETRRQQIQGRCFICFRDSHMAPACPNPWACAHCHKKTHHRSLCPSKFGTGQQLHQQSKQSVKANTAPTCHSQQQDAVILQTAVATIGGDTITQPARLMFDTGSSRSFITQEAQQALQLDANGSDTIAMAGFGDSTRKVVCLPRVQLSVGCDDGSTVTVIANVVDNITCPIQRFPLDYTKYPVLQSVNLAEPTPLATESVVVDVLIGSDHYHHLIGPQVISVTADLVLVESKLGFIPSGKVSGDTPPDTVMHLSADSIADDTLPALEDLWSLESLGINDNPETTDNDMVREHFNATIRKENGRYTVNWPWKEKAPQVNYELARGRLVSLIKRLSTQPDILRHYDQTIRDQHASGIIEEVPNAVPTGPVHYLPHHCVQRQASTTTKLRIVYDASAKTNKDGNSLNDCLHSGPSLLPDLGGILVRFRLFPVGITSDIEKAFLQVGLDEPDRDYTRFLWLKDISQPVSPANLVTYRFCRIPFGVISSPFLLSATIHHHLDNSNSTLGSEIRDSTYVDNVITGRNTADEASTLYDSAKSLFNDAAMNLREWSSNSDEFNHTLPDFDKATSNNVKCLGLAWDTKEDTLNVISPNVAHKHANTKRSIISAAARFYDPVGYLSPLFVRAKLLIQDIWKAKLDWDDPVPNSIADDWQAIAQDLDKADTFKLHRFTGLDPASVTRRELHVFCDASEKSYGTVAYLREESATAVATVLLVSKTKVAPLKQMTIPRLELMAALIGSRLIKFLQNTLPFDLHRTVLWSDSTCVLHWINGTNQQSVFVQRRLMEIRSNPTIAFKYVNTDYNPADLPSRGATAAALHDSKLWWEGPEWLRGDTSSLGELPSPSLATAAAMASEPPTEVSVAINSCSGEGPFISIERYSSWSKAVRVMAYVKLAVQKLQGKCKQQTQLTTTNIKEAEMECVRVIQGQEFGEIKNAIQKKQKMELVTKLGLLIDTNGLIRCAGRMKNARFPESGPILLPRKHPATRLIVQLCHARVRHSGTSQTLMEVRKRFWITRGRATVQTILHSCYHCKKWEAKPYPMPDFAPLPSKRVNRCIPFSYTGIDYFGPMTMTKESEKCKVWVCLFTCLTTRAIHLELMEDMTTASFLLGFRRFIARRGTPIEVLSDNAKQFHTASNVIGEVWNDVNHTDDFTSFCATNGIQWKFIVQLSPWMGGAYERLVQSVKRVLRKTVGTSIPNRDMLNTFLMEAEAIINARPLVYVGNELDFGNVLTPNHFLSLNPKLGTPGMEGDFGNDPTFEPDTSLANTLLTAWTDGQRLLQTFWSEWQYSYLPTLRERGQTALPHGRLQAHDPPAVDTVVLVKEEKMPRGSWLIGRIDKLHNSNDGEIRSATVVLPSKRQIQRPLCLLYPIVQAENHDAAHDDPPLAQPAQPVQPAQPTQQQPARPTRRAAAGSRANLKNLISQGAV